MATLKRSLRGAAFEELLNLTNQMYRARGLAVIHKIPTPITPVEVNNAKRAITKAYFDGQSSVDYVGVAQGIALAFDAKETRVNNFPLRNVHQHQIDFMNDFTKQEGVAFLLINFVLKREAFFLPFPALYSAFQKARSGERKSIPYEDFDKRLIIPSKDFPAHYLAALNAYFDNY